MADTCFIVKGFKPEKVFETTMLCDGWCRSFGIQFNDNVGGLICQFYHATREGIFLYGGNRIGKVKHDLGNKFTINTIDFNKNNSKSESKKNNNSNDNNSNKSTFNDAVFFASSRKQFETILPKWYIELMEKKSSKLELCKKWHIDVTPTDKIGFYHTNAGHTRAQLNSVYCVANAGENEDKMKLRVDDINNGDNSYISVGVVDFLCLDRDVNGLNKMESMDRFCSIADELSCKAEYLLSVKNDSIPRNMCCTKYGGVQAGEISITINKLTLIFRKSNSYNPFIQQKIIELKRPLEEGDTLYFRRFNNKIEFKLNNKLIKRTRIFSSKGISKKLLDNGDKFYYGDLASFVSFKGQSTDCHGKVMGMKLSVTWGKQVR